MPRPRKDSRNLNIKIDTALYDRLADKSVETKLTKTAIVELALEQYLKVKKRHGTK